MYFSNKQVKVISIQKTLSILTVSGMLAFSSMAFGQSSAADDKKAFFSPLRFEGKHSDGMRRIALYMAMNDADKDAVSGLFASIGLKSDYDILLYSYYLAKNGEYEDAEKLAYYFFTLDRDGLVTATNDKFGILGRIFRILKKNNQLQKFEPSYVDELEANLKKIHYPFDRELSFNFMCK